MRVHDLPPSSPACSRGASKAGTGPIDSLQGQIIRTARILEAADRFRQQVLGQPQDLCEDFDTHRGDVREELEVMAARILPLPVPNADIIRLETIQREHGKAADAGDLLAVFHSNVQFHRLPFSLCGNM